ncbi:MAG: hypothetical protein A2942_00505 [Candidatus Lloydbacteria bacterium RIFCSPLOWO2_01_FULL_50_20]|uniref:Protein kinase domain-containing protein n=1 Tax=Candidatus Lloydbacteria bacterium RIFCSPLOWO2_01_FULL_50_20 TaxID=1798665 RepID=A0A1G2DEH2_9BACT|nr:MAG: hypothetical protein A3C13_02135 [Candidatus Lloydbacteria bacterium RIFCSPHIGHO2_02_FULL_50_11]OGZ11260.1 MAG: hypothetical protein A2942_00505 [Candidatus Lloydbacteria bacterium RIFCSPLOWO2_01_FULL_50_20]
MSALKLPRKIILEGKGTLTLRLPDYLSSGGEGSIYRVGNTVIKLYVDQDKMRYDGMAEKITLLRKLTHPSIVAPCGIVTLPSGEPIGFHMAYVSGEPLSRVFTNDFRQREGFTDEMAKILVARMRETVDFAHDKGAILVDANELNWLAQIKNTSEPMPYVIDVDSWAIGKFGASVIMPSIRDWHAKRFDQASDWFAWGIVTFQLWTGIHPYKGKLDGYRPGDLETRMKANKSVFSPGVRLNRAVRDFRVIPAPLTEWYEATFEKGLRTKPPSPLDTAVTAVNKRMIMRIITTQAGALIFEKLFEDVSRPIIGVFPSGILRLGDGTLLDLSTKRTIGKFLTPKSEVIKVEGGWLLASIVDGTLVADYVAEATGLSERLSLPIALSGLFRSGNRLFAVTEQGLTEFALRLFGKPILAVGGTWGAPQRSTKFFDGVGIHDSLGAKFLILPFAESACAIVRTPELDSLTVVDAKGGARFVAVIALKKNGEYERLEFTLDREHGSYVFSRTLADTPELNMVILPKGVVASVVDDGSLMILVPTNGKTVHVADKYIATDMMLTRLDDQVLYIKDGALWSVRMR